MLQFLKAGVKRGEHVYIGSFWIPVNNFKLGIDIKEDEAILDIMQGSIQFSGATW